MKTEVFLTGVNLRTLKRGIFPMAHIVDVEYNFDGDTKDGKKERSVQLLV